MTHSLDRLSNRERDLLILLAQGHTAKSIASVRGLSVNVVNEQLRSARRKTGAMSSRELARVVVAQAEAHTQETCDQKFEIEGTWGKKPSLVRGRFATGARSSTRIRRVAMSICVLAFAGLLAHQSVTFEPQPHQQTVTEHAAPADPANPDVVYQVLFMRGDAYLGSPTVVGRFGREVNIEVPNAMRVLVSAGPPDSDGASLTTAQMFLFENGGWREVNSMSMNAFLTATPSIEYSVEGTPYRFVIMVRRVVPAAE